MVLRKYRLTTRNLAQSMDGSLLKARPGNFEKDFNMTMMSPMSGADGTKLTNLQLKRN